jgi:hypothetical protein
MSDPVEIPLEELISALLAEEEALDPRYLIRLSDLEAGEVTMLVDVWPRLPAGRRKALVEALEDLGAEDDLLSFEAVARHAILDEEPQVRELAVRILWEFDADDLLQIFLSLLESDPAAEVRAAAATGLGQYVYQGELEELPEGQLHALEDRLLEAVEHDPGAQVRRKALEALGFSSRSEVPGFIEKAFESGDRDWVVAALAAMGRSMDSRWEPSVLSMLDSKLPVVRAEAARAAGELEIGASVEAMVDLTEDSDESVSSAAIWSLSQIGGEQARRTLETLFREVEGEEQTEFLEAALDNLAFTEGLQPFSILDLDEHDEEGKSEQEIYEMLLREEGYWDGDDADSTQFEDEDEDFRVLDDFDGDEDIDTS